MSNETISMDEHQPKRGVSIRSMLDHARAILGTTMHGYKGGEYVAHEHGRWRTMGGDDRIVAALDLAVKHGGHDGAHHKAWVIDQMVRALAGDRYDELVRAACGGEDGPETYRWDVGIAP